MLDVGCFPTRRCQIAALLTLFLSLNFPLFAQETQRQYLSGHGKDDAVPWEFMCAYGAQSGYWTNLPVPSQWDVRGFGTLNYHKDLTNAWDEKGLYAHNFTVPKKWSGQRIFLVFEGVMTDTSAKLNGQSVGPMHQGSFYRFKYEVTQLMNFGATNRLEVTVAKHSANASVNNAERLADYWVFGGIFRPVYLEAVPPQFIGRLAIDAKADGEFMMDVFANGASDADTLEAQITTLDGKSVGKTFSAKLDRSADLQIGSKGSDFETSRSGDRRSNLTTQISSPRQWTAETPNLYSVEVRLKRGGKILHRFKQRFGFRTFEVRDGDGLYVNGQRVILKGADRHSFWPDSGRCLSEAVHRLDIETMKDMNMNAVRMSHYPPDEMFLDLCDELGLYVLDELAGWHNKYDNEIGPKLVHEMVTRDVNHPSILFWDNGNEGGFNTTLDHLFPELDPQHRRVLHPWANFGGVNTGHYQRYDEVKNFCASNTIYMPTEFQHGLFDGGAGAGLDDYWKVMSASKVLGGGFIWALTDDGVKRPDTGQIDVAGNQAPDGIVGPYREREGSFYTIKEIWSPIQVTRQTNGTFTVENHYSFTDASQCKFTWELRKLSWPFGAWLTNQMLGHGTISAPGIPPGGKATFAINLPKNWVEADLLTMRVEDPNGRELWTWTWPMPRMDVLQKLPNFSSRQAHFAGETADSIQMQFENLLVSISKQTGFLTGAERNGQKFSLSGGPRPAVGGAQLRQIETNSSGGEVAVAATFSGNLKKVVWQLRSDGWLQCDYTYTASGTNDYFGVLFDYPENLVKHKRWLGAGPFRVWKNRLRGATLNVWENDYNNTLTGYRDWIYPEFKGFFANVRWLQLDTTEGQITVVPDKVPFVQVLTPEFPPANLVGKAFASVPKCGLGFLDAIPPIGSKFKEAKTMGPQSQPNIAQGEYSGSVSFYFGKLP
jgi:hypothetical protein